MALIKLCLELKMSKCSLSWICSVFSYVLEQVSSVILSEKNWIISVTSSQKQAMWDGHCLQAMKIVHHYASGCFDWLISELILEEKQFVYCLENTQLYVCPSCDRTYYRQFKRLFPAVAHVLQSKRFTRNVEYLFNLSILE